MKIRHKQSGVELEWELEDAGLVFIQRVLNPAALPSMYSKQHWEEVKPAPKWVDVTGECYVNKYATTIIRGVLGVAGMLDDQDGYRFRKVAMCGHGCVDHNASLTPQYAFIIEQR